MQGGRHRTLLLLPALPHLFSWVSYGSCIFLSIFCPNCACMQLFLVPYSFLLSCCQMQALQHSSKGSQVPGCLRRNIRRARQGQDGAKAHVLFPESTPLTAKQAGMPPSAPCVPTLHPESPSHQPTQAVRPSVTSSIQISHSVVSDSLRPHESQHARPPCPSPTPGVHSRLPNPL